MAAAIFAALRLLPLATMTVAGEEGDLERIDALSSCEEVEASEQAAQDARAEVYLAWLDDYRGTLENGRQCIASLESGETPADAQRRRRLAFIRSHSSRSAPGELGVQPSGPQAIPVDQQHGTNRRGSRGQCALQG